MLTRLLLVRVHAKKDNFISPPVAPGERKHRFPTSKDDIKKKPIKINHIIPADPAQYDVDENLERYIINW
tara:strand:+ start:215 stop:424 length:210 start_codon:yes stop_codon:yes gene_type:complete